MLDRLRTPGMRRLVATTMVAAAASLSFPFILFAPEPPSPLWGRGAGGEGSYGVAAGKPNVVTEDNGTDEYTVTYDYSSLGDREYVTYDIGGSETRWHYKDYDTFGFGTNPARVFTRMNRMSWTGSAWVESSEEMAYAYDALGRLRLSAFAQTPQSGEDDYETYPAASRALAAYAYDPGGRITEVTNWWQTWNTTQEQYNAAEPIVGTTAAYSTYLALKGSTAFIEPNGSGGWQTDRTEYYTYDAQTDWLTGVDYNDGLANEVTTWTYDAAGNRASDSSISGSWTYDNLNRMTASPYGTYTNDILGNRTLLTTSGDDPEYHWDPLNRLQTYEYDDGGADEVRYAYRADGMRTYKIDTLGDDTETWYYHDGQMCVQDTTDDGTDVTVTKYGVGARGIDVITKKVNSGSETFGYPIYDSHGNMIATLARSGSNSYSTGNAQTYDVWGGTRSGSSSEDQGYVANLGHRTDSESDLQYMRARYYEPGTGRFISQDRAFDGINWYSYATNSPTNNADFTGDFSLGMMKYLKDILSQFGPLGSEAYDFIATVASGGVAFIVAKIVQFAWRVWAKGILYVEWGGFLAAQGEFSTYGGSNKLVAGGHMIAKGVVHIMFALMLGLLAYIIADWWKDELTE